MMKREEEILCCVVKRESEMKSEEMEPNGKRLREKERAKQKVLSDRGEKEVMWGPMF